MYTTSTISDIGLKPFYSFRHYMMIHYFTMYITATVSYCYDISLSKGIVNENGYVFKCVFHVYFSNDALGFYGSTSRKSTILLYHKDFRPFFYPHFLI